MLMKLKMGILSLLLFLGFMAVGCSNSGNESSSDASTESIETTEDTNNNDYVADVVEENTNSKTYESTSKENTDNETVDSSTSDELTTEDIKGLVIQNLPGGTINDVNFDKGKITVSVELGDPTPITLKDVALVNFGGISDDLLERECWDTLTVKFEGVGEITMDASSAVLNEYGHKYFASEDYEEQL